LKENFDRFNSQIYKEKEMADFRRCILAFAVVALLLGLLPAANAQVTNGVTCVANAAVPPALRAEGLTELAGDIVLNCTGGTATPAGQVIPQANIQVFFNTQVTSRVLSGTTGPGEAVLTVDEPTAAQAISVTQCTSITGCTAIAAGPGTGPGNIPNSTEFKNGTNPNVFEGQVLGNSVLFVGIPIDPPGSQGNRIYRMTNIRVNANAVSAPGANGVPGQVIALVAASPATNPGGLTPTFSINNPQVTVGFVQTSLATSITGAVATGTVVNTTAITASGVALLQCVGRVFSSSTIATGQFNFSELFPTAFKTHTTIGSGITPQNVLGLVYNSETGYYNTNLTGNLASAGLADFGTRLRAVFNNVPNGVSVWVSISNTSFSATANPVTATAATLVASEALVDGTTGFTPVAATTTVNGFSWWQVPIVNGSGEAVWEVTAANPLVNQTYSFDYLTLASPSPSTNSPAIGTGTVNLWYAPTAPQSFAASVGGVAGTTALPIPRFVDSSVAANAVAVTICRTNLLYPYVTSQAGFDTGIAISNTSTDPFGTAAQAGPCTLYFYGTNAPASVTTPSVASGAYYAQLATQLSPNFTGYIIALCNFQYAHGFAFISDVGARNLAMGYLALVIPDPAPNNRQAAAFECGQDNGVAAACDNSGEELGN